MAIPQLKSVDKGDMTDQRIWKAIESIGENIEYIKRELNKIVKIEERVEAHTKTLSRYGEKLDKNDDRIRELELSNVENKRENKDIEKQEKDIEKLKDKVNDLAKNQNVNTGQKDVFGAILKWVGALATGILLYALGKM